LKKYFWIPVLSATCFCISCNGGPSSGPSEMAKQNLDKVHEITKSFTSKDFNKLGDYILADAIDHAGDHGDVKGLDSIKAEFVKWSATADEKVDIIKEVADDEYVMSWTHNKGKYKIAGEGFKVDDTFNLQAVEVARFKDGKVAEHWTMMPPGDVMRMMNKTTAEPTMPADSMKMKKKQ
jgi:hypothetical protein